MSEGDKEKTKPQLFPRTKEFALRIIRMYGVLPRKVEAQVIGKQVLRSGTSIGANYWEAAHARSKAEFISKVHIAIQEAKETRYWLDLLAESGIVKAARLSDLQKEADEIISMLTASAKTAGKR